MKTILLVEDDPFILDIYVSQFKQKGFLVDVAKDGQTAMEKIKSNHPDILLLDILLPKINGIELLRMIRNDEAIKNTKVIVISNLNQKDYAKDIADLGVIKYFLKIQTTPEEIVNNINEILNTKS